MSGFEKNMSLCLWKILPNLKCLQWIFSVINYKTMDISLVLFVTVSIIFFNLYPCESKKLALDFKTNFRFKHNISYKMEKLIELLKSEGYGFMTYKEAHEYFFIIGGIMNILNLIGRNSPLFHEDINLLDMQLTKGGLSRTIPCNWRSWINWAVCHS